MLTECPTEFENSNRCTGLKSDAKGSEQKTEEKKEGKSDLEFVVTAQ